MKRIIALLMVLALVVALAACSANTKNDSTEAATTANTEMAAAVKESATEGGNTESTAENKASATETGSGSKSIVVYFSRTGEQYGVGVIEKGNTAWAAEHIREVEPCTGI